MKRMVRRGLHYKLARKISRFQFRYKFCSLVSFWVYGHLNFVARALFAQSEHTARTKICKYSNCCVGWSPVVGATTVQRGRTHIHTGVHARSRNKCSSPQMCSFFLSFHKFISSDLYVGPPKWLSIRVDETPSTLLLPPEPRAANGAKEEIEWEQKTVAEVYDGQCWCRAGCGAQQTTRKKK